MTRTILGGYVLRDAEIYATIGSITLLKSGERIATKDVRRILYDCPSCKREITDAREVPFVRQSTLCYKCCTGDILDFCHKTICETLPTGMIELARAWLLRLCPSTSIFRTQPHDIWHRRTELHWSYEPSEGFIRVGYDIFRVRHKLTRAEINASMHNAIYKGVRETANLTRPKFLEMRRESSSGSDHDRIPE
jgi:hypothetical protein